jgi:hypothetical protein
MFSRFVPIPSSSDDDDNDDDGDDTPEMDPLEEINECDGFCDEVEVCSLGVDFLPREDMI